MFRLVATFQECCLKALNSRERFFKVTNVLVIERSVDWRLPIQFVFCFHRDQFLPIPPVIHPCQPPTSALVTWSSKPFLYIICAIIFRCLRTFNMANQSWSFSLRGFYGRGSSTEPTILSQDFWFGYDTALTKLISVSGDGTMAHYWGPPYSTWYA